MLIQKEFICKYLVSDIVSDMFPTSQEAEYMAAKNACDALAVDRGRCVTTAIIMWETVACENHAKMIIQGFTLTC